MRAGASGGGWASVTDMADGPFRFGVIGAPVGKADHWRDDSLKLDVLLVAPTWMMASRCR
jgi:hypothetical protein